MKYYIIAGEASGDLHGSNLMKAIIKEDPKAIFRFWGGDLMKAQGGTLVKHYRKLAFMGFIEVVLNIRTIFKNLSFCKKDITTFNPDTIILIDYPGFNMRIAKWAKSLGKDTQYYISPQIWAWKENRIKAIKRDVNSMYVILPFEKPFYENKHHFPVHFVGHPLIDAINQHNYLGLSEFKSKYELDDRPIIAILPGSRKQEIKKMLKVMLEVSSRFKNYQFIIAGAPSQPESFYKQTIKNSEAHFISNDTYNLLNNAHAALVTSGTATLETALFKVPQVVCYKGSWISYEIGKRIIDLKFISLVNLIMDKEVVMELIQNKFNSNSVTDALRGILNPNQRTKILENYEVLEKSLGGIGASENTAKLIVSHIKKND